MSQKIYPSWRYHKEQGEKLIHSGDEDAALGSGWVDTPAAFEAASTLESSTEEEKKPKKAKKDAE